MICILQHRRLEQVDELFRKVDDRRKVSICFDVDMDINICIRYYNT